MSETRAVAQAAVSTRDHIARVSQLIHKVVVELLKRADQHDASKLEDPERATFGAYTARLKTLTYGSDEYKKCLTEMKPALDHHYANNRHHPEHFPSGVNDMTLVDLIEALCDWKSASERHNDGNIRKSIEQNRTRFSIDAQLAKILENTVRELGTTE